MKKQTGQKKFIVTQRYGKPIRVQANRFGLDTDNNLIFYDGDGGAALALALVQRDAWISVQESS